MRDLLKFLTCGSVDDGKSTLIGRLLADAHLLLADQMQALESESRAKRRDGTLDYALLLDGLIAEREQGITIDVAYRYFTTTQRSFIVADAPGHEEYTRNMAVGASASDLAVLLIDASKGVLPQTRRHLRICSMMGIRHFVFAVNKMDLVDFAEETFRALERELRALLLSSDGETADAQPEGTGAPGAPASLAIIPVCAARGDNVVSRSAAMPWYSGPALLAYLETVDVASAQEEGFVMPVQRASRPDASYRGYQGQIACGEIRVGDAVTAWPNGIGTSVESILVSGRPADSAAAGCAVSISLADEIDLARGSVLARDAGLTTGDLFVCSVLWTDDAPLVAGRRYCIRLGTQMQTVTVQKIKYREDLETGRQLTAPSLRKNEIGALELACSSPLVFDTFDRHRAMGRFILIDLLRDQTAACGIILHPMRRTQNLRAQQTDVTRETRAASLAQRPKTIWFTGLSGSGKTALAGAIEQALADSGLHTMLLDGDNVRLGLNRNLGFTEADRIENIRRVAEVAKLMNDAGLIVLTSFISPFAADRASAREIIGDADFIEIYVSTPLAECERRDVKGLYQKARAGEIPNFTGIGSPYEPPEDAAITIDTTGRDVSDAAAEVLEHLNLLL